MPVKVGYPPPWYHEFLKSAHLFKVHSSSSHLFSCRIKRERRLNQAAEPPGRIGHAGQVGGEKIVLQSGCARQQRWNDVEDLGGLLPKSCLESPDLIGRRRAVIRVENAVDVLDHLGGGGVDRFQALR